MDENNIFDTAEVDWSLEGWYDSVVGDGAGAPPEKMEEERSVVDVEESKEGGEFSLKHLDRTLSVSRDEVVKLAQKGLDYDRVKTKYSKLSELKNQSSEAMELLESLASKQGVSLDEYVSHMKAEKEKEGTVQDVKADGETSRSICDEELFEFLEKMPEVKSEEITQEVWEEVAKGRSLLAAYALHENTRLRAQLDAERQNMRNRSVSVSSRSSEGNGIRLGELERLWYSGE